MKSLLALIFVFYSLAPSSLALSESSPVSVFQKIQQHDLDNGVSLYYTPLDSARFFKFTLYVWAGSVDEVEGQTEGAAHAVEHLLFQLEKSGEIEFDQAIKALGGSYNAFTYRPYSRYFVYLPKEHLEEGVSWLWRVVFNKQLRRDRFSHVQEIIDRENGWSDPTWIDMLQKFLTSPEYLKGPGFWQRYFGWPAYDRPVSGRAEIARGLRFQDVEAFHQRYYNTANVTAIYVGPHLPAELLVVLNNFAGRWPGITAGRFNQRAVFKPSKSRQPRPYRSIEFNDQQPSVTLGYLFDSLDYKDAPFLTLYTQLMRRHLYEKIRLRSAQTYVVDSTAETFGHGGYLAFHSQANRLSFSAIRDFMMASVLQPLPQVISEEQFAKAKADQLQFIASRLHQPEVIDAFLGLMVRKYPNHKPLPAELDWLGALASISYDDLAAWVQKRLKKEQRYEYLTAPSMFLPYEILPLILITAMVTLFFWKRMLLNPANIRQVRMEATMPLLPVGFLPLLLLFYLGYYVAIHLLHIVDLGVDFLMMQGLPLYFGGYLSSVASAIIVVSVFILTFNLMPRRVLITPDRLTIKSLNYFSFFIPLLQIQEIERGSLWQALRAKALPLHLFFRRGILLQRKQGLPLAFRVKNAATFVEMIKLASKGRGRDYRQISFPGMRPMKNKEKS